jgi:hypothetical protein
MQEWDGEMHNSAQGYHNVLQDLCQFLFESLFRSTAAGQKNLKLCKPKVMTSVSVPKSFRFF